MARPKKNTQAGATLALEDAARDNPKAIELLADHAAIGSTCRYTDEGGRVHAAAVSGAYSNGTFALAVFDAVERCVRHLGPVPFGDGPGTAQAAS